MTRRPLFAGLFVSTLCAGCGGGGSGISASAPPPAAAAYTFAHPTAGAHLVYGDTLIDNLSNTINRTLATDVTALNADGSFATREQDPSGSHVVSGTVDHTFYPTDNTVNAAGQRVAWSVTGAAGNTVSCSVTAGHAGAPSPLTVGQSWSASYTEVCGAGAGIDYTQSGTLMGVETLTVPAGTFSAFKFLSTTAWTVNGRTTTATVTRWRDASAADSRILKTLAIFTYAGSAAPQGALVSETQVLQSYQ